MKAETDRALCAAQVGVILKKRLDSDGVPEKWRNVVHKLQRKRFLEQALAQPLSAKHMQ